MSASGMVTRNLFFVAHVCVFFLNFTPGEIKVPGAAANSTALEMVDPLVFSGWFLRGVVFMLVVAKTDVLAGDTSFSDQKMSCQPGKAISDIWWTQVRKSYRNYFIACDNVTNSCNEVSASPPLQERLLDFLHCGIFFRPASGPLLVTRRDMEMAFTCAGFGLCTTI